MRLSFPSFSRGGGLPEAAAGAHTRETFLPRRSARRCLELEPLSRSPHPPIPAPEWFSPPFLVPHPSSLPAPRQGCHPGPHRCRPPLGTRPAGAPCSAHRPPLGVRQGAPPRRPTRRIPGKAAPAPAPRPGEAASPPTEVRVPCAWRSGRRPVGSPARSVGDTGPGSR